MQPIPPNPDNLPEYLAQFPRWYRKFAALYWREYNTYHQHKKRIQPRIGNLEAFIGQFPYLDRRSAALYWMAEVGKQRRFQRRLAFVRRAPARFCRYVRSSLIPDLCYSLRHRRRRPKVRMLDLEEHELMGA